MLAQISPDSVALLAPYLTGPGAAVLVLVAVLGALYVMAVKHIIPLVAALGKRHLEQIDALIANQKEESSAITKTLASIDHRLARLEGITDAGSFSPNLNARSPDRLS